MATATARNPTIQSMEWRLDMRLRDPRLLALYMTQKEISVRELADEVERRIRRKNKDLRCGHAMIGHLRTGKRRNTSLEKANAIEDALGAPRGALFMSELSNVQPITGRKAA